MTTEEASACLQLASEYDAVEPNTANVLRAMLGEIHRLGTVESDLRAELAILRSAPVAVEVPELSNADLPYPGQVHPGSYSWQRNKIFQDGYTLAASRARAIPSDRVLKEGEREELEILREIADIARPRVRKLDKAALCDATRRLDAVRLRSQRAAEGGAA